MRRLGCSRPARLVALTYFVNKHVYFILWLVAYVSTNVKLTMVGVVMAPNGVLGLYSLFGMMLSFLGNALKIALFYVII